MFVTIVMLAAAAEPVKPQSQPQATVRIVKPGTVSEAQWKLAKRRRDRIIHDEQGRELRLRTIDFE